MEDRQIIVLKNETALQEINCPYCGKNQEGNLSLIANIIEDGTPERTTCICSECKEEFIITSFSIILFETEKLKEKQQEDK